MPQSRAGRAVDALARDPSSILVSQEIVGIPVGLLLDMLAVRVLGLVFTLPPPVVTIPSSQLGAYVVLVVAGSAVALGGALVAVRKIGTVTIFREP